MMRARVKAVATSPSASTRSAARGGGTGARGGQAGRAGGPAGRWASGRTRARRHSSRAAVQSRAAAQRDTCTAPQQPGSSSQAAQRSLQGAARTRAGGEVWQHQREGAHKQAGQLVDDADLLKDDACTPSIVQAEQAPGEREGEQVSSSRRRRKQVTDAAAASKPPARRPAGQVAGRPRTRRVEGGQEGDVAVADADRVLDKQVGEAVGKAPAKRSKAAARWSGLSRHRWAPACSAWRPPHSSAAVEAPALALAAP